MPVHNGNFELLCIPLSLFSSFENQFMKRRRAVNPDSLFDFHLERFYRITGFFDVV